MGPIKEQAWSNLWAWIRPTPKALVVVMAQMLHQPKSKDLAATTTTLTPSSITKANCSQTRSRPQVSQSSSSPVKIQIKIRISFKSLDKGRIIPMRATSSLNSSNNWRCNSRVTSVSEKTPSRVWVISSLTKLSSKMILLTTWQVPATLTCQEVKTSRCIPMLSFRVHLPIVSSGCLHRSANLLQVNKLFPISCSTLCKRIKPMLVSNKVTTPIRCKGSRSRNLASIKMRRTSIKSKECWGLRVANLNRRSCNRHRLWPNKTRSQNCSSRLRGIDTIRISSRLIMPNTERKPWATPSASSKWVTLLRIWTLQPNLSCTSHTKISSSSRTVRGRVWGKDHLRIQL